ncbi:transporter/permease protein [Toxoplasma gondii ARI]|uniref:Transporter/permease protein n=1 Tax=Toxoplasma gondii ARI TaxID=1074872 RepID=A0A139XR01_TOXGO|nr:transporter/permease protein [Toxoplasma gondii ARI]
MPKDRTRRVLHTTAHQRLSFCDASGTTRRDESGTKACGDGYSRQADRSGTPHSSFRESSVSGFEDKHDASSICLGDSAEFQDLLCSDDGRKTVNLKLAGCVALFLVAYCIQPLLVDALKFEGAAATSTCIYLIPHFLGMLSVVFTVNDSSTQRPTHRSEKPCRMPLLRMRELHLNRRTWRKAFFVAGIDLLHQVAEKAGLVLCGSGAYVLVSSSSIVWTAVISACVLRRKFSSLQWMSLMLICGGISMKAADLTFAWQNEEFLGVTITFLSAILQGLTFVVNEKYMTSSRDPVSGPALVFMMGVICSSLMLVWSCIWTLPNFQNLVVDRVRERGGSPLRIAAILFGLFCSGAIHSSTLWYIVKHLGAVTSGVLKGVKTASVFLLGHVFFCHLQESQCLNPVKTVSATVCVGGVVLYYVATSQARQLPAKNSGYTKSSL